MGRKISKAKRFRIFMRDSFRCVYCGRGRSESVVLHVDHCIARSKGGSDAEANLATACQDCNLGKSDALLPKKIAPPIKPSPIQIALQRQIQLAKKPAVPKPPLPEKFRPKPQWRQTLQWWRAPQRWDLVKLDARAARAYELCRRLLDWCWIEGRSPPEGDQALADLIGITLDEWRDLAPNVWRLFRDQQLFR